MKNLYQIAADCWKHETSERDPFSYVEPEWEQHATALLVARGGGAKVTKAEKPKPVTVLDVQIVVDPAQVGTVHPYRVIIDGASGGPVDLDEAIEELRYAAMNKGQRKGVQAIFEIRQARR